MESNKYIFRLKIIAVIAVCAYVSTFSKIAWAEFKDWAMAKKAKKMMIAIESGYCADDAKCKEAFSHRNEECTVLVNTMRFNKDASEFGPKDRRLAIGCMHKTYMSHSCTTKKDVAKAKACGERIEKRYDKCFDYTYAVEATELPTGMGANMVGCMYGVMFVQDDNAEAGISIEDNSLRKKPKMLVKPIDLNGGLPGISEINELKDHLAELGEQRIENFNEAMDALQEMRGGAAVDKTADVDVFDKTGNSQLQSAGIGTAPAAEGAPAAQ